jgi:uncharacterized membrane protein YeaQ/YmgE (transglycosylase-associated protein family)
VSSPARGFEHDEMPSLLRLLAVLLGLATGWVRGLVHEDELTRRRRVGVFALAAGGALLGGMLGAALGLSSFSLIRFGSWHTAIGGAALLLWILGVRARSAAATTDQACGRRR